MTEPAAPDRTEFLASMLWEEIRYSDLGDMCVAKALGVILGEMLKREPNETQCAGLLLSFWSGVKKASASSAGGSL